MPAPKSALVAGDSIYLRRPRRSDAARFVAAVRDSARLHRNWVQAPSTPARFAKYLARFAAAASRRATSATHVGLLACRSADHVPVGVFNLSEIVRGAFRSTYLGYYALAPHDGRGYMAEGLALVLRFAFGPMKLHRVEINIQPANLRSIALARRAGFLREGFSRRYVKLGGRWRDHERWALTVEDWRAARARRR
ncbi:MAG TPA: GNAT family protein [Casimicrobiaceae bacterium]|nr:GNAT family protein [Casimicrobiaceae bacterium]